MNDNYQAVYDAVRSRFNGCDTSQAVESAISNAFSNMYVIPEVVRSCISEAANEMMRPFFLLKPKMFPDGDQWCALYGENLQEGVAGFGDTPAKAATQFDVKWLNEKSNIKPKVGLLDGLDMDAIKKEEDHIVLNQARYAGYKLEPISDNYSDSERKSYYEGVASREDVPDIFERMGFDVSKFPSVK